MNPTSFSQGESRNFCIHAVNDSAIATSNLQRLEYQTDLDSNWGKKSFVCYRIAGSFEASLDIISKRLTKTTATCDTPKSWNLPGRIGVYIFRCTLLLCGEF